MDECVVLGKDVEGEDVALSYQQRRQHTYVLGVNGTGKSTLLGRIALGDILHEDRHGLCVIDPHGDLIDDILVRIPESRAKDVVLLDPSERDWPFALNLFAQPLIAEEADLLASEIVGIFAKVFGANWGPRIEDVTRNLAMTLLTRPQDFELDGEVWPPALDEIPALLRLERVHPEDENRRYFQQRSITYRQRFYQHLRETGHLPIEEFWQWDYDTLTPRPRSELVSSVLNKVRRFLANPMMRNILAQTENRLDLRSIMDEGKILLVRLSKGKLGDDNANFLGSVIVAKLLVAVFARADQPRETRRPFHIIVDEFQNFATSSFPTLLTEARKYAVDIVIAHQYRDQLRYWVQGATSTAGNIVCFRLNGDDADDLAKDFDQARHLSEVELLPEYAKHWLIKYPTDDEPDYKEFFDKQLRPILEEHKTGDIDFAKAADDRVPFGSTGASVYFVSLSPPTTKTVREAQTLGRASMAFPGQVKLRLGWIRKSTYRLARSPSLRFSDAYRATANALTQLPNFHAICRLVSPSKHLEATFVSPDWEVASADSGADIGKMIQNIKNRTHDKYCRPREEVEQELEHRYSKRLQAIGLPPLQADQPLPDVDGYESDDQED